MKLLSIKPSGTKAVLLEIKKAAGIELIRVPYTDIVNVSKLTTKKKKLPVAKFQFRSSKVYPSGGSDVLNLDIDKDAIEEFEEFLYYMD